MTVAAISRVIKLSVIASFVASSAAFVVVGRFAPLVWQSFVVSFVYSAIMGAMAAVAVPRIVVRIGRPGPTLTIAVAGALLSIAAVGSLLGSAVLVAVGLSPDEGFWPGYLRLTKIAAVLILISGFLSLSYDRLMGELRRAQAQLHEREIQQARAMKEASDARLMALEARIHPHVLFNTLNAVSALIPVDAGRAEATVGKLASLLRSALTLSGRRLIPLSSELTIVRDYLDIERERLGPRLIVVIEADPDTAECDVPPFSVQSLVENAITHAIAPSSGGGRIAVSAHRDGGRLQIDVRDSGPGFNLTRAAEGHGLHSLVTRLDATFGHAADLAVSRGSDGCTVTMRVPARSLQELAS